MCIRDRIWTDLARLVMLLTGLTAVGILVALLLAKRDVQPIREISSMLSQKRESGDELYTIQTGIIFLIIASATFSPSIAADMMPPA